jgi:hypothetical protein
MPLNSGGRFRNKDTHKNNKLKRISQMAQNATLSACFSLRSKDELIKVCALCIMHMK